MRASEPATPTDASPPSGRQYQIAHGPLVAVVSEVGATLRSLRDGDLELLDGFGQSDAADSGRGQVLAPWPNRLDGGRFRFDQREATAALDEPERNNAIHGLVRWLGWDLLGSAQNVVTLGCVLHPQPGYPWRLRLAVEYRLVGAGLTITTTASTDGRDDAPFGLGFHPYFRLGAAGVDALELQVPASMHLITDERGLPIASAPVEHSAFDFRAGKPIGDIRLDTAFCGLERDRDGLARMHLQRVDRRARATVWLDRSFTHVMVYSGDTLPDVQRRRRSVAIEPMTCPPNALRTGTDLIRLRPGATWQGRYGIEVQVQ